MDFEKSKLEGTPHYFFTRIAGGWTGMTRTWLEPDGLPHESQIQGSIQLLLDGRFAIFIYQSSLDGEPVHGMFTFGYNTTLDRYEASWIDSFHNNRKNQEEASPRIYRFQPQVSGPVRPNR